MIAAKKRGVDVRIMLNPSRRSGKAENQDRERFLQKAGVKVIDSNPAFGLTHEKSMVVDDTTAFVKIAELGNEESYGNARLRDRNIT